MILSHRLMHTLYFTILFKHLNSYLDRYIFQIYLDIFYRTLNAENVIIVFFFSDCSKDETSLAFGSVDTSFLISSE